MQAPFNYWDKDNLPPLASPCIEVPTGGGKSAIIGATIQKLVEELGCRVVLATHRSELIEQDAHDLMQIWPKAPIGIYSASLNQRNGNTSVCLAGVQTVANKAAELGWRDVLLVDEAHLINSEDGTQYTKLIEGLRKINPDMRLIGYTATPYRLGQGMLTSGANALFNSICYKVDIVRLIEDGFLSPLVTGFTSCKIDTDSIGTRAGEFIAKDLELAANVEEITKHVIDDLERAFNDGRKKALIYGVSVAHASFLRNEAKIRGISCEMVDGSMDRQLRKDLIQQFKKGAIKVLTSCDVLTTGFNCPDVDVVSLVRPTQSTALYVQILGRGMRIAPGKQSCLVLDYGGNIARHGPIDKIKVKEKQKREGKGELPIKECGNCFAEVAVAARECVHCGFQFPPPERKANKSASNLPVIAGKAQQQKKKPPVSYKVDSTSARVHYKGRDTRNTPTCCVEYFADDGNRICSEWLCFDHPPGFAQKKAQQWWQDNVGTHIPINVIEAVERLNSAEFPKVIEITVDENEDFPRVVDVFQDENSVREPGMDVVQPEQNYQPDSWLDDDLPFMRLEGAIWW